MLPVASGIRRSFPAIASILTSFPYHTTHTVYSLITYLYLYFYIILLLSILALEVKLNVSTGSHAIPWCHIITAQGQSILTQKSIEMANPGEVSQILRT